MNDVAAGQDEIAVLLATLERFAGTTALADDTTAVLVRWGKE